MAKKYKMVRVPEDVFKDWKKRRDKIQERIKLVTHKPKRVSLTNVFKFYGKKKIYIFDDEVLNFFNNKGKKNFGGEII